MLVGLRRGDLANQVRVPSLRQSDGLREDRGRRLARALYSPVGRTAMGIAMQTLGDASRPDA